MPQHHPQTYVALLRGINVGGHKKVPMAELKKAFEKAGFTHVRTLLNTGNVVFESTAANSDELLKTISAMLEATFTFSIPVILRPLSEIREIISANPFKEINVTPQTRLYVTFLADPPKNSIAIPYTSPDASFKILSILNDTVFSVLDLSKTQTVDTMRILEKESGKNITTRNWNTVVKIGKM